MMNYLTIKKEVATTSFFNIILPFVFDRISDYVSDYKTFFRYCPVYE